MSHDFLIRKIMCIFIKQEFLSYTVCSMQQHFIYTRCAKIVFDHIFEQCYCLCHFDDDACEKTPSFVLSDEWMKKTKQTKRKYGKKNKNPIFSIKSNTTSSQKKKHAPNVSMCGNRLIFVELANSYLLFSLDWLQYIERKRDFPHSSLQIF